MADQPYPTFKPIKGFEPLADYWYGGAKTLPGPPEFVFKTKSQTAPKMTTSSRTSSQPNAPKL